MMSLTIGHDQMLDAQQSQQGINVKGTIWQTEDRDRPVPRRPMEVVLVGVTCISVAALVAAYFFDGGWTMVALASCP